MRKKNYEDYLSLLLLLFLCLLLSLCNFFQTWAGQTPTLANGTPSNETGAAASRGTSSDRRGSAALSLQISINSQSLSSSKLTSDGQRRQSSGVGEDRATGSEPSSSSLRLTSQTSEKTEQRGRSRARRPRDSSDRRRKRQCSGVGEEEEQWRRRRRRAAASEMVLKRD
ncbi:unnamed protein product [Brassica rapa subsp. trilocularis]